MLVIGLPTNVYQSDVILIQFTLPNHSPVDATVTID